MERINTMKHIFILNPAAGKENAGKDGITVLAKGIKTEKDAIIFTKEV